MTNNFVQVPPNSTGVKLQTFENTINDNVVDAEAMVPVDASGVPVTAAPGSAVPASGILVGGSDGTDLRAIATDTGGQVKVLVENGSAIPVSLPTGQAVELLDSGGTNKASISAAGAVKVDGSAVTQPISGSIAQGAAAANTAGWPTTAGGLAESTAAWTSATTVNTALQVNCAGYGTIVVTLNQGSTLTGSGVVTFEASDTTAFTNAYGILGTQTGQLNSTPSIAAYSLVASTNVSFVFNVAGWAAFRVRLSTAFTGTGTVNVGISSSALTTPPIFMQVITGRSGVYAISAIADNQANVVGPPNTGAANVPLVVADMVYGGAFSGTANAALSGWSKGRTPTVFKTVQATASGNTAVWTPGSGNKFRLLKVFVQLTDNASITSGGVVTISFQDGSTTMPIAFDVFVPASAVTTVIGDGLEQELDLGNFGILSAAANNILNVNLSTVLATGNVRIIAMGTEE